MAHLSPMKASEVTRERVRLIAAITGRTQIEVIDDAVTEFVERHAEDFALGLKRARQSLLGGLPSTVAYLLDLDEDEIKRVASPSPSPKKR